MYKRVRQIQNMGAHDKMLNQEHVSSTLCVTPKPVLSNSTFHCLIHSINEKVDMDKEAINKLYIDKYVALKNTLLLSCNIGILECNEDQVVKTIMKSLYFPKVQHKRRTNNQKNNSLFNITSYPCEHNIMNNAINKWSYPLDSFYHYDDAITKTSMSLIIVPKSQYNKYIDYMTTKSKHDEINTMIVDYYSLLQWSEQTIKTVIHASKRVPNHNTHLLISTELFDKEAMTDYPKASFLVKTILTTKWNRIIFDEASYCNVPFPYIPSKFTWFINPINVEDSMRPLNECLYSFYHACESIGIDVNNFTINHNKN